MPNVKQVQGPIAEHQLSEHVAQVSTDAKFDILPFRREYTASAYNAQPLVLHIQAAFGNSG